MATNANSKTAGDLKTRVLQEFEPTRLMPNVAAGLVMGVVAVTISTAFGALIFSGGLADSLPRGIGVMLVASMIVATLTALFSSLRGIVAHLQENVIAILAVVSSAIVNQMPASATAQDKFITVTAAIALSSVLTGILFLSLGQLKLGNLIRFIPYPVFGGFLAGSGLLLIIGAIALLTGAQGSGVELLYNIFQLGLWTKLLPGLFFAVFLLGVLRHRSHALIVPGVLTAAFVGFYIYLGITNTSIAKAAEQGWLLGALPNSGSALWPPPTPSDFLRVNWSIIVQQFGSLLFVGVVSVIAILLNATGIELATGQDVDLNRDLKSAGLANLVAGLAGGMVGYHASGESALIYKMGARSRFVGVIPATVCGIILLLGGPLLSYFPNPILGGLLLFFGLDILAAWIYDAWFRLPMADYLVVLAILVAIGVFGILEGVGLGIALGIILFVVDYSRVNVVKHALNGNSFHSNVDRPRHLEELLREEGGQLFALELQGFIFFGTAQKLLDTIRKRFEDRDLLPAHFLVLDFQLVNGVDSSAVLGFVKIRQLAEARGIITVLTNLSRRMQRQMKEVFEGQDDSLRIFADLDHGVEWCENKIIETLESVESQLASLTLMKQLEATLPPSVSSNRLLDYFEERKMEKGDYIITQGSDPSGLYFIEKGQVTVQLENPDGKTTRLRTMQTGTVVGELGTYLGQKATASVVADETCTFFYLSVYRLKEMENREPELASAFHKFIVGILGERLMDTNDTLHALLA
jgi:SulP family sulfate permease